MATFSSPTERLPFVLGGSDQLTLDVGAVSLDDPLAPNVTTVFKLDTSGTGQQPLTIGAPGSWTLGLAAATTLEITAVWPTSTALVSKHGLASYFAENPGDVVLVLDAGANAGGTFSGQFTYAPLTANVSAAAGGSFTFTFAHAYRRDCPLKTLLSTFLGDIRLPATLDGPPAPGEVIKFEYGGYLNVGASLGVGYSVKGTPSIALGQLQLSEDYSLSVVGTLGLAAHVGGFFAIEMRGAIDAAGRVRPGWARIVVRKTRASEFSFAADVSVGVTSDLKGLPEAPNEFLGALLGVNVKNWLNLLEHVRTLSDWNSLATELDGLAIDFLTSWVGEQIDRLTGTPFPDFLARVAKVVDAYHDVDASVLTILDRYFDALTNPQVGDTIAQDLERLAHLPAWSDLKGEMQPQLWQLVTQLTDGDPLGWMAGVSVDLLQKRAASVIALGQATAGPELTAIVGLAKRTFGLDPLVAELASIDTIPKLKAAAGTRLGAFVERLLGADITRLQNSELGAAVTRIHQVLDQLAGFEQRAYAKFADVVKQNVSLAIHAEYSRAADTESLIDIAVNMAGDEGKAIVRAAALGDFSGALAAYRPDLVELNQARLTHNITRQNAVSVNVIGWHAGWHYQGVDKVVVGVDQQIVTEAGAVTVYTTADLSQGRERKRANERTYASLLLRFVGESRGAIALDERNERYLIDAITSMSASYELAFEDDRTTFEELSHYLGFASAFGLLDAALDPKIVAALLPRAAGGDFGAMSATYDVRFDEAGLRRLFTMPLDEDAIRKTMRQVILVSYLRVGGPMADVGWAYWTPGVFDLWSAARPAFASLAARELKPIAPAPFTGVSAPRRVVLAPEQQRTLDALYGIEQRLSGGFMTLARLVRSAGAGRRLTPHEFENALASVGEAFEIIDRFGESVNTTFAVFDTMLRQVAGAQRASTLTLRSQVSGRTVTKVFLAPRLPAVQSQT